MAGFIKIERDLMNLRIFQDMRNWWMWCKLKFLEAYEDGEVRLGKSRFPVAYKKGQIAILMRDLCAKLEISHKSLREFLNELVEEGLILLDVQPKYTIITFVYSNENSNQNAPISRRNFQNGKSKFQSTHIIKEVEEIEEDKEEKKIIYSSTTTREEEIEFLKNLENDVTFFESMAMLHHIDMDVLKNLFQHFKEHVLSREPHRDFADCRNHFKSWLSSDYAKKLINNNGTRTKTEDKYAARRGTAPGSHTQEDYGGKF